MYFFTTDTHRKELSMTVHSTHTFLTALDIYNSQHSTHMLIFDEGGKPEYPEKNP
jgi:hypothetical protein